MIESRPESSTDPSDGFGPEDWALPDFEWLKVEMERAESKAEKPLELLVKAIVAANPLIDDDPAGRFRRAMKALFGSSYRHRPKKSDDDILMEVAWAVRNHLFKSCSDEELLRDDDLFKRKMQGLIDNLEVGPIVVEILEKRTGKKFPRTPDGPHADVRRIQNKFTSAKHLFLTRLEYELHHPGRKAALSKVYMLKKFLAELGVEVDLQVVGPRQRADEK